MKWDEQNLYNLCSVSNMKFDVIKWIYILKSLSLVPIIAVVDLFINETHDESDNGNYLFGRSYVHNLIYSGLVIQS